MRITFAISFSRLAEIAFFKKVNLPRGNTQSRRRITIWCTYGILWLENPPPSFFTETIIANIVRNYAIICFEKKKNECTILVPDWAAMCVKTLLASLVNARAVTGFQQFFFELQSKTITSLNYDRNALYLRYEFAYFCTLFDLMERKIVLDSYAFMNV